MDEFTFRNVRPDDRAQVLEFTANTWGHGDYIHEVFDLWLAEEAGRFLAIEHVPSGRVAGIDKLSFYLPGEAWFEGLRISPDFRGRGLATGVQRFMIEEARRQGAHVVRLLSRVDNVPIHLAAYRDGFRQRFVVRHSGWRPGQTVPDDAPALDLRPATAEEAPILYRGWLRSSAYRTGGLVDVRWCFVSSREEEWIVAALAGDLLVDTASAIDDRELPAPCLLINREVESFGPTWRYKAACARFDQWVPLLRGGIARAREAGVAEFFGFVPDEPPAVNGARSAGLSCDVDEECLALFELAL